MIIDAHAHIFRKMSGKIGTGQVEGIGFGRVLVDHREMFQLVPPIMKETTFPPEVFVECMTWAGVDKAVLLQGPFYGERNTEVAEAIRRWPDHFTGAAFID